MDRMNCKALQDSENTQCNLEIVHLVGIGIRTSKWSVIDFLIPRNNSWFITTNVLQCKSFCRKREFKKGIQCVTFAKKFVCQIYGNCLITLKTAVSLGIRNFCHSPTHYASFKHHTDQPSRTCINYTYTTHAATYFIFSLVTLGSYF